MSDRYADILDLPRPESRRHPRMSRLDRAAQFAPFAALTGLDDTMGEQSRLTQPRPELVGESLERLDRCLTRLMEKLDRRPEVTVRWFRPDEKKQGGSYQTLRGSLRVVDTTWRRLIFADGTVIPLDNILEIEE